MKSDFDSIADKGTWKKGIKHISKVDKKLAKVIKTVKMSEIELEDDYYSTIITSFINQQIGGAAARSILKKFMGLYGGKLPKPKQFLKTSTKKLRSAGLSPQKISYITDLCERIEAGRLFLHDLHKMEDEDVVTRLDEVRGIGRWTAEMFLMFSLGRADVFPKDDLGIQSAMKRIYGIKREDSKKMEKMAEKWRPYRTIASLYLWHSMDNK